MKRWPASYKSRILISFTDRRNVVCGRNRRKWWGISVLDGQHIISSYQKIKFEMFKRMIKKLKYSASQIYILDLLQARKHLVGSEDNSARTINLSSTSETCKTGSPQIITAALPWVCSRSDAAAAQLTGFADAMDQLLWLSIGTCCCLVPAPNSAAKQFTPHLHLMRPFEIQQRLC